MTKPTITVGHGFFNNMDNIADWAETEGGITGSIATDGDVITITCTNIDNAAYEYVNYLNNPADFSGTQYKYWAIRWKTASSAAPGVGFGAYVTYSDATSEFMIGTAASPEFSAAWKISTGTLTANKTISSITFFASDSPATLNSPGSTYYVYVDWILLTDTKWTFPKIAPGSLRVEPDPHIIDIGIPGRTTDITQNLGEGNLIITLNGDIDSSTTWYGMTQSPTNTPGEIFYALTHVAKSDPCELFTSDKYTGLVTIRKWWITQDSEGSSLGKWYLQLKEYRLIDPTTRGETFVERYGLT